MLEYINEGVDAKRIIEEVDKRQKILQYQTNSFNWFLGRVQHKLTKKNSVRDKRPYFLSEELKVHVHLDHQREYDNIYAIRGWTFQENEKSIVIRVSDETRKSIDFFLIEEERADVESAFHKENGSILGFNIYINKANVHNKTLQIEFQVENGFCAISLEPTEEKDSEARNAIYYDEALSNLPTKKELDIQRKTVFEYEPLISVIVPLYNTPIDYLKEMIDSVLNQSYSKVELCLADGSSEDFVEEYIKKNYSKDSRVIYKRLENNGGISENTNAAFRMAKGDFIMLCDHDDVVMLNACYEMVKALNEDSEIDIVYTDEDKVTMTGDYYSGPHFKPDFNLTLLLDNNYICHIFMVRKSIVDQLEGPERKEYDGAQDYDFILRCSEKARKIHHVRKVLYHWRCHPLSTSSNPESKSYAYDAGKNSVAAYYERNGIDASVEKTASYGRYRTFYKLKTEPLVSVFVWGENQQRKEQMKSEILDKSDYKNLEFFISKECTESLVPGKELYSEINDIVKMAAGEYILLIHENSKIDNPKYIENLLCICQNDSVSLVGPKIIDKDKYIYSCGQAIDEDGYLLNELHGWPSWFVSYTGRAESRREVSVISMHGLMLKKSALIENGGFHHDMGKLSLADLCLRVCKEKQLIVVDVYTELFLVNECGQDENLKRITSKEFQDYWKDFIEKGDPMYNPNLKSFS